MAGIDWRDRLMQKNGPLFFREFGGRMYSPGRPAVGDGWRQLFEIAVNRIRCAVTGSQVLITQVKSTSGSIRILWETPEPIPSETIVAIEHAIALAKARSLCTCEVCGAIGILRRRGERLGTACDEHGAGVPEPIPSGFENLHVVLEFEDGRPRELWYRRYNRKRDRFLDADASSRVVVGRPNMRLRARFDRHRRRAAILRRKPTLPPTEI